MSEINFEKMKKVVYILFVILAVGCKNDNKENKNPEVTEEKVAIDKFFSVTLDVVAKKDDSFHVFYTEDGTVDFNEKNSVWCEFKGSDGSQKLVFNLPKDVSPTHLRIDFGLNKEQSEVKINNLILSYFENETNISGIDFFKYFSPNIENTIVDVNTQTIKPLIKNTTQDSGCGSVYPTEALVLELQKITN